MVARGPTRRRRLQSHTLSDITLRRHETPEAAAGDWTNTRFAGKSLCAFAPEFAFAGFSRLPDVHRTGAFGLRRCCTERLLDAGRGAVQPEPVRPGVGDCARPDDPGNPSAGGEPRRSRAEAGGSQAAARTDLL